MDRRLSTRLRPIDALSALAALQRDPDDTGQVFKVIAALSGRTRERMVQRVRALPAGQRLLRERPALLPLLADRARLGSLPEGSLGRTYLAFCESHGITADGLVAASREGGLASDITDEEMYLSARMRDAHDLFHVIAGYQTDLIGEISVLAFTVAQTRNPGVALIVLLAYLRPRGEHAYARKLIKQAFARGLRAAYLPATHWEDMLARKLEDVRRELGVDAPPNYRPLWPHEIFADKKPRPTQAAST